MAVFSAGAMLWSWDAAGWVSRLRSGGIFHDNDYLSPDAENR